MDGPSPLQLMYESYDISKLSRERFSTERAAFMWAVSEEYAQMQSKTDQQSFLI